MNLSNLKPAKGSVKIKNALHVVRVLVMVVLLREVIKVKSLVQVILKKSGLKVVKCLYNVVFLSLDLRISTGLIIKGINLDTIQALVDAKKIKDEVTFEILLANGLVRKNELVKILGRGVLTAKLNVTAHKFTATAQAAIEASGGTATNL